MWTEVGERMVKDDLNVHIGKRSWRKKVETHLRVKTRFWPEVCRLRSFRLEGSI